MVSLGAAPARISPFADVGSCRVVVPGKFEMWMVGIGVRGSYLFWRVWILSVDPKADPSR